MPIYKPRLTRTEQAKYLAVARELVGAGVTLRIPDEWCDNASRLQILIDGPPASSIYQLASGLVVYAVHVRILAERGAVILQDFQIIPAWDSGICECSPEKGTGYRFAPGLDYEWNEVLNHRIVNLLRFSRRGDMQEGWLLAMGYKPVPEEYGPGRPAPLEVAFLDQFSQQHTASAVFAVERSAKATKPAARPRTGLWEREDTSERVKGKDSEVLKGPIAGITSRMLQRIENESENREWAKFSPEFR
jgi:hypothetical protein